nr:F-box protein At5g03100-like isoform X1 [Ipomoea batatas]
MVDYFSMLPDPLIHHILSFLPFQDIVRTCTLSKDWYANLHTLMFSSIRPLSSELKFSVWNVPKLDNIELLTTFLVACEAGREEFLMKLHNYEDVDLKLVIFNDDNLVKSSEVRNIIILSRDEAGLDQMLGKLNIRVASKYMMCSPLESAEQIAPSPVHHSASRPILFPCLTEVTVVRSLASPPLSESFQSPITHQPHPAGNATLSSVVNLVLLFALFSSIFIVLNSSDGDVDQI